MIYVVLSQISLPFIRMKLDSSARMKIKPSSHFNNLPFCCVLFPPGSPLSLSLPLVVPRMLVCPWPPSFSLWTVFLGKSAYVL